MAWRAWMATASAVMTMACGGSEFDSSGTGGAAGSASGGAAGSGGTAAGGSSGGGGTAGVGGSAGAAGAGGNAGAAGVGGSAGSGGGSGISVVQATPTEFDVDNDVPTITFGNAPAAGNTIIVGITCFSEVSNCSISATGVTDNQGNTYVRVVEGSSVTSSTTHGSRPYIFFAENVGAPTGAFTISVDPEGSQLNNQIVTWGAIEVSGLATAQSLDQTGTKGVEANTSTTVTTTASTTQANELAVAVLTDRTNDTDAAIVPEMGWTQHHINQDITPAMPHSMVSLVLSATGVVSHTWTHDVPTRGTTAVIATFKGAAAN